MFKKVILSVIILGGIIGFATFAISQSDKKNSAPIEDIKPLPDDGAVSNPMLMRRKKKAFLPFENHPRICTPRLSFSVTL
jgi:hypothetical protein